MASQTLFDRVYPFPNDLLIADIPTISLAGLKKETKPSAKTLLHAAQTAGVFLLDLQDDDLGEAIIREIDALFEAMHITMNTPGETKRKFESEPPKSFLGFKPRGTAKTENGQPDRFEWFNMALDGLSGVAPSQPLPDTVEPFRELFASYAEHGRDVTALLYKTLAEELSLPKDTFTALAPVENPSGSILRFIKAFASPTDDELRTCMHRHTDFGTITLLVNVLGGLQILRPEGSPMEADSWLWVQPKPNCLIVNLGDAMVQWTGGILHSNIHRIYLAPGKQRLQDRYSLGLLFRPERNASMKRIIAPGNSLKDDEENGDLTAWEWEVKKAMALMRAADGSK